MAVTTTYPGVYIDEFTPAAPIQGVSTSIAAFLGLSKYGPPNKPTPITSWDAFVATFTSGDPTGATTDDDDHLWYAVKGFFQNGGQTCYVIAVSNATPDAATLLDEASAPTIEVKARQNRPSSTSITVKAEPVNVVKAYSTASTTGVQTLRTALGKCDGRFGKPRKLKFATATNASRFVAGDDLKIDKAGGGGTERRPVSGVIGDTVVLAADLPSGYTTVAVTLAPLATLATTFRVQGSDVTELVPGSIVTLSQTGGPGDQTTIVKNVSTQRISTSLTTYRVETTEGLKAFDIYDTNPVTLKSEEFMLTVSGLAYSGLSMNPGHPRYFEDVVNNDPTGTITAATIETNTTALPGNRPYTPPVAPDTTPTPITLTPGQAFNAAQIKGRTVDYENALKLLERIPDVSIVVVADRTDDGVQKAVLAHCETLKNRFAILDAKKGTQLQDIDTQRAGLASPKGYASLYYPWISVISAKSGKPLLVPPAGTSPASTHVPTIRAACSRPPPARKPLSAARSDVERAIQRRRAGPAQSEGDQRDPRFPSAADGRWSGARAPRRPTRTGST